MNAESQQTAEIDGIAVTIFGRAMTLTWSRLGEAESALSMLGALDALPAGDRNTLYNAADILREVRLSNRPAQERA